MILKAEERKQQIIEMLVEEGTVTLERLAQHFDVSKMTIHRDLDELEAEALLRKVRGGATIESSGQFESDFRYRSRMAADEKRIIARYAASFVEPGMSVMIDDGSTSQSIAPFLLKKRPLTIITNNQAIITVLAGEAGITMISLGGVYSKKFNGFFGIMAEEAIERLRADVALMSSSSVDGKTAFHQDQEVVEIKRRMIRSSAKHYLMIDHKKFGRTALHYLADLSEFDGVITTAALASATRAILTGQGIKLHFAVESDTQK